MKKKRFRSLTILTACAISISCLASIPFKGQFTVMAEETVEKEEEKIECVATIENDFDDSSILVVLDKKTSAENNEYSTTSFGDIDTYSVACVQ